MSTFLFLYEDKQPQRFNEYKLLVAIIQKVVAQKECTLFERKKKRRLLNFIEQIIKQRMEYVCGRLRHLDVDLALQQSNPCTCKDVPTKSMWNRLNPLANTDHDLYIVVKKHA